MVSEKNIEKQFKSIDFEISGWKRLINESSNSEYLNWQFPEFRYYKEDYKKIQTQAYHTILKQNPYLRKFFKIQLLRDIKQKIRTLLRNNVSFETIENRIRGILYSLDNINN